MTHLRGMQGFNPPSPTPPPMSDAGSATQMAPPKSDNPMRGIPDMGKRKRPGAQKKRPPSPGSGFKFASGGDSSKREFPQKSMQKRMPPMPPKR